MSIFVDTSAIFALVDGDDANNKRAKRVWEQFISERKRLITTNYVIVESFSLFQKRLGTDSARDFYQDLCPLMSVQWVDAVAHNAGMAAAVAASSKKLSLVDCVSFVVMRRLGLQKVFTFDRHFREQGFTRLP